MATQSHVDENNNDNAAYFKFKTILNNKESATISKIPLSKTVAEVVRENHGEHFKILKIELEDRTTISQQLPFEVVKSFGSKAVTVFLEEIKEDATKPATTSCSNVFEVLMRARIKHDSYPGLRTENNQKDRLFNHTVGLFKKKKGGFTNQTAETTGKLVIETITNTMWYLDPFWERLNSRSVSVPDCLRPLTGYREFRKQKKKLPKLETTEFKAAINEVSEILMLPWIENTDMLPCKTLIEQFVSDLQKYHTFLTGMNERTKSNQSLQEPVRSFNDNWTLKTLNGASDVKPLYHAIDQALRESEYYQIIDLVNFEPEDKEDRRKWLSTLQVSCSVNLFTYHHGNYLGNTNIVWKTPEKNPSPSENARIINLVKEELPKFSTRRMRKDFFDRYTKLKVAPVVMRDMYKYLTGFSCTESEIDVRFVEFLMETGDCDLVYDLRKDNARPSDPKYTPFWEGLEKLISETSAVHERRQTNVQYLPFAMSVEDLREKVVSSLPPGTPAPSCSWIRLNFQPRNPYNKSAENYTGKVNLKYAVQQRLLRVQHEDGPYCRHQFKLLKCFAVKYRDFSLFQCLDDKAIIPVGDPGHPVSTGVRSHHGAIVANDGCVAALDHDFHIAGIVPSVCFMVDIPETPVDSFYRGQVHVTVKDKVFQSSSPLRHSTETVKIMQNNGELDAEKPILIRYTDGGPDHRTNFKSVQMSALCEFIALDLDMLVCARTAPSQSYHNPAERVMSTLNLGLQNVALERPCMPPQFELQVKSLSTLKSIRNAAERSKQLKTAYQSSMEQPVTFITERFSKLKWSGESLVTHKAATTEEMDHLSSMLHVIDPNVRIADKKTWKSDALDAFMSQHSRQRVYMFQLLKCGECSYCTLNPPRLPEHIFEGLHFLPDAVMIEGEYKSFEQVYGTETDDSDRPSASKVPETTERDKNFKSLLVATKVRAYITCCECGKRRVVHSAAKLTTAEARAVTRVEEELMYVCGNPLFHAGRYRDKMLVRESLSCVSPIEATYYAGKTMLFDDVCFYCGDGEVAEDEEIRRLKEEFGIVRPICATCKLTNPVKTRSAKKVKKT